MTFVSGGWTLFDGEDHRFVAVGIVTAGQNSPSEPFLESVGTRITKSLDLDRLCMAATDEFDIGDRITRLEEIAETLEEGEIGLKTAKELREEADEHLEALREDLDVGDGAIIEIDDEDLEPPADT